MKFDISSILNDGFVSGSIAIDKVLRHVQTLPPESPAREVRLLRLQLEDPTLTPQYPIPDRADMIGVPIASGALSLRHSR